jgi:hypothetical protein
MLTLITIAIMQGVYTENAKLNGDMAVVYTQYHNNYNEASKKRTFCGILPWDSETSYQKPDMVWYNKKVYACIAAFAVCGTPPDQDYRNWTLTDIGTHSFGISAQKRFKTSLDNFANIFLACYALDKNILAYEKVKNNIAYRKPTFCTLTLPVPVSADQDVFIKKNLFDTWLKNIVQNKGVKLYVWRAEAQLNGNIHFHIVFDRFLDYKQLKKGWYRLLKQYDLTHPKLSYEEHSRIVWIQELPRVELIKHELAGYFAADTDDDGNQYYKHKKYDENGNPIYVRQIQGRQWGDADALNYPPFCVINIDNDLKNMIASNCLFSKIIKDSNDKPVADLYVYRQVVHKKGKKPFVWSKPMHEYLTERLYIYHLAYAKKIYQKRPIDQYIWDKTFNSGQIDVYHQWRNEQYFPDYNAYKFYVHK